MNIRPEQIGDYDQVYQVQTAAFGKTAEANLVNQLRQMAQPLISLIAESDAQIIGHVMFSPVTLPPHDGLNLMGLGPVAVSPTWQKQGIGRDLINAGLSICQDMGIDAVAVLGHPSYYPRFGFVPSVQFGIKSQYDVPDDVFMMMELNQHSLAGKNGTIYYHDAFQTV